MKSASSVLKLGSAVIAAGLATAAMVAPSSARDLVYSHHAAPASEDVSVSERYFERIAEATAGEHQVKVMSGGVLASPTGALSAVASGAIDAAILTFNYTPSDLPTLTLVGDLVLYGIDPRAAAASTTETLLLDCEACTQEMEARKINVMMAVSTAPYNLMCRNRNVASLADMVGMKVRGAGSMGLLAAALGATPVNVAYTEIYEALQRGQIDCALLDTGQLIPMRLPEVIESVTDAHLGNFQSIGQVAVNLDVWKGFTPEQRRIWLDNAPGTIADYQKMTARRAAEAVSYARENNVAFVTPTQDFTDAVRKFRMEEEGQLVEIAAGRGVKDAAGIARIHRENVDKWVGIVAGIGDGEWNDEQWNRYIDALKSEIYAKLPVH